jgi:hypothetical protein
MLAKPFLERLFHDELNNIWLNRNGDNPDCFTEKLALGLEFKHTIRKIRP